jgi:hypothetical protein
MAKKKNFGENVNELTMKINNQIGEHLNCNNNDKLSREDAFYLITAALSNIFCGYLILGFKNSEDGNEAAARYGHARLDESFSNLLESKKTQK